MCGLVAGLLGGYMGLGGGVIMIPFMTIVMGMDIKAAAPISMAAIVVGSLASSTPYLKKRLVDNELVVIIAIFMVIGSVVGSHLSDFVPSEILQLLFGVLILYAAIMLLTKKNNSQEKLDRGNRGLYLSLASLLALFTGTVAALLGVGGGIFIIPILYLIFGVPLNIARGTSAMLIGFSAAAASAVYFANGRLDPSAAAPVMLGVAVGGMIGGHLGTLARPTIVKLLFFAIMLYVAFKLGFKAMQVLF